MAAQSPSPPSALRNPSPEEYTKRIIRQKVWRQCNVENQHWMGAIVGREGSGKSYTALKIMSAVDPTFSADRVFFDPKRLLETLQDDSLGAGTAVVIDEAGVGLGNRTWYEKDQILLNQALQTARDDNYAVAFTLPRLSELDSQTIGRLHTFVEMTDLNKPEGYADARWLRIDPSRDESGKIYKKYPILRDRGREYKIERVRFTPPDMDLVKNYEARKDAFKDDLYQRAIDAMEDATDNGSDELTAADVAEEVLNQDRVEEFVLTHSQNGTRYVDNDLLKAEYGLSQRKSKTAKKLIQKKMDEEL